MRVVDRDLSASQSSIYRLEVSEQKISFNNRNHPVRTLRDLLPALHADYPVKTAELKIH